MKRAHAFLLNDLKVSVCGQPTETEVVCEPSLNLFRPGQRNPQFTPDASLLRSGSRADRIPFPSMQAKPSGEYKSFSSLIIEDTRYMHV